MAVLFDTHQFIKKAQECGFSEKQAEFQANELINLVKDEIATKQDINNLKIDIKDIKKDMENLKNEILIKLGSLMVVLIGILGFILKH